MRSDLETEINSEEARSKDSVGAGIVITAGFAGSLVWFGIRHGPLFWALALMTLVVGWLEAKHRWHTWGDYWKDVESNPKRFLGARGLAFFGLLIVTDLVQSTLVCILGNYINTLIIGLFGGYLTGICSRPVWLYFSRNKQAGFRDSDTDDSLFPEVSKKPPDS